MPLRGFDGLAAVEIVKVLDSGPEHRTRDIDGTGTTADFTAAMCETLRRGTRAGD